MMSRSRPGSTRQLGSGAGGDWKASRSVPLVVKSDVGCAIVGLGRVARTHVRRRHGQKIRANLAALDVDHERAFRLVSVKIV